MIQRIALLKKVCVCVCVLKHYISVQTCTLAPLKNIRVRSKAMMMDRYYLWFNSTSDGG